MNATEKELLTLDTLLDRQAIYEAVRILKKVADDASEWDSIAKLNHISDAYHYLCHYFLEGAPDPTRHQMISDMSEQLREVRDRLIRKSRVDEQGAYYASVRLAGIRNYNLPEMLTHYRALMSRVSLAESVGNVPSDMSEQRYDNLEEIFTAAMISFQNSREKDAILKVFPDPDAGLTLKVQLLSALTLGLLAWFDINKFQILLDIAENENADIALQSRAFVGIVFALMAYSERISKIPSLMERLTLLFDNEGTATKFRAIIKAIAGTRDTERVSEKMAKEVIPEIMKLRPDIINKMKDMGAEIDPESIENNPDWQEMLDKSGIARKLEELQEMQSDGADLMMVTFSNLKQFHFFRNINNWFLPFDSHNPQLRLSENMSEILDSITRFTPFICDSDKYSLALGLAQTPEDQRKMLTAQFDAQFKQMSENLRDKIPDNPKPDFEREAVKIIRDFYRYLMLGRNVEGFYNPFKVTLNFTLLPVVGEKISDPQFLRIMAEFYLKREFYTEALDLFSLLVATDGSDSLLWQKIGFCRQKTKDFKGAREAYMKSELLGDDTAWLQRKLAYVNKRLGDYRASLEYYTKVLENDPENISMILNAARMAVESGDYTKALSHYYHADYLRPDNMEIMRGLAWTEMLSGNHNKSENIYSAILLNNPMATDWLNAGHVAQLGRHFRTALERYRKAAEPGKEDFSLVYQADIPTLERLGADPDGIRILLDEVLK